MLFRMKAPGSSPEALKPFVFKISDGFLIGLAMDPHQGAPCAGCVQLWLADRELGVEPVEVAQLHVRRDLLDELIALDQPHIFFEITRDGSATKLECAVFPHPRCQCHKGNYVAPKRLSRRTNFTFSPILRLSSERHGTPQGSLWITAASGFSPLGQMAVRSSGSGLDKETSRLRAIDQWLQRAGSLDADWRLRRGELLAVSHLQTGRPDAARDLSLVGHSLESQGTGKDREEAALDALTSLTLRRTLKGYGSSAKNPMLIVGANNWLRERVPFSLLQHYDMHLLFYPNSTPCWVVGLAAFSRLRSGEKPIFVFASDAAILAALDKTLGKLLEACLPAMTANSDAVATSARGARLNMWWTHWIYRCPKISLSDVLHLEPYQRALEPWLAYLRDGQPTVVTTSFNHADLPAGLRTILRLKTTDTSALSHARPLHGIGTWTHFQDALM